ncbi:MAG: hypothetical protein ACFFDN_02695 [Candidatus Hodarchaeota archaeon]
MSLVEELLHYVRNNIDVLLLLILFALVFFTLTNLYLIYRIKLKDIRLKQQIKAETEFILKKVKETNKTINLVPIEKKENDLEEYP